jgi:hypothetical protein
LDCFFTLKSDAAPEKFLKQNFVIHDLLFFAAPGNYIRTTTIPDGYDNTTSDTSVAAPHVAGAAALIKSLHPNATPAQIEKILHNDATKVPPASKSPVEPRQPCDGKARGYFAHAYPPFSKVRPGSDKLPFHYEDLLFMGNIK